MNSLVLKDYNYSEALYNYKCVLADAEENLLGFALQSYGDEESAAYLLLSWNGEKFETLLSQNLTDQAGSRMHQRCRHFCVPGNLCWRYVLYCQYRNNHVL